jgi:hypothetical protein
MSGKKVSKKRKLLIPLLAAGAVVGWMQLDESKKRFILHMAKQAHYLPGRYYA